MDVTVRRPGDRQRPNLEPRHPIPPIHERRATVAVGPQTAPWLGSAFASPAGKPTQDERVRALIASHEDERRQIARDLHDVVGQALTAISLHLDLIRREPERPAVVSFEAGEAVRLIENTIRQVRELAFEIRPALLDDLGLVATARSWLAYQTRISGLAASFCADVPAGEPPTEITSACFRALQEAVTNVSRHAAASVVEVSLVASTHELVLTVRDDGVGFEPQRITRESPRHWLGLLGTAEQVALVGGDMTIESTPTKGTTFRASFPWRPTETAEAGD